MPKPHQAHLALLHPLDEAGHILGMPDLLEHAQHRLVCAAVQRTIQRRRRRREGAVGIGVARTNAAHHRGRTVLLVVGVENEEHIERLRQHRIDLIIALVHVVHHVKQVGGVAERAVGQVEGPPDAVAVGKSGDGRDLPDNAPDLLLTNDRVLDIFSLLDRGWTLQRPS